MGTQNVLDFWAKKSEDNTHYPLLYHMMDAAAVCQKIWEECLHESARRFIAGELQLSDTDAVRWISFWVGLHDIGKATPDFQGSSESARQKLTGLLLEPHRQKAYHGTATACILQELFQNSVDREIAKKISVTLGGHHGVFPRSGELKDTRPNLGDGPWNDARGELYKCMIDLCGMRGAPIPQGNPNNAFFMVLAGLTSVADWIASNEGFFPYEVDHQPENHLSYAEKQSNKALNKLGWTGWKPTSSLETIREMFPFITEVRPLQNEAISLAKDLKNQPNLVIIEAPMGEGKTEAAIYLADSWVANLKQKGYYFALPTMATSDQMFGRVGKYLEKRYPDERVNFMLLHGHAALSGEFETLKDKFEANNLDADSKNRAYDGASPGVIASEWFTHRKRGLLAPFGVGTIDQALLAVLQTRHVFVRLFGLAHKTVIIDEVHAYDAYMTTLLERLLEWLAALGSSVVLLSATLPRERKNTLLQAYQRGLTGQDKSIPGEVSEIKYPRISWTTHDEYNARMIETSNDSKKKLQLQWAKGRLPESETEFELGEMLREVLADGGCAAVICNTVDRAQRVYQALKPYFETDGGNRELDLLHARYLYGERKRREDRSLLRFGKPGAKVRCEDGVERTVERPKRAVLVATQIIEQSLDIDFDLMVTEMAPVDLLLQRAGRLHRHKRDRPDKLKAPTLRVCQPEIKGGAPFFGEGTEAVYDYHILLRSWLAISSYVGKKIRIPEDVEGLIEDVYGEREYPAELPDEVKEKWEVSKRELEGGREKEIIEAWERWIKWPGYSQEFWRICSDPGEEDNPEFHKAHQALTRLTGLTVNLLCLSGNDTQVYLDSTLSRSLDKNIRPPRGLVKELLMHTIPVSRRGLVEKIVEADPKVPQAWREEPLLRNHYIMFFDENKQCEFKGYILKLDVEQGLRVEKL